MHIERNVEARGQRSATASAGEAGIRQVLYHPVRPTRDGRNVLALSPLALRASAERDVAPTVAAIRQA